METETLSYPETLEHLVQVSVNLLSECKKFYQYMPVSLENQINEHLALCKELGFEQTSSD